MIPDFPWERYGLSADPDIRHGQLSTCCTDAAIIWATKGERALQEWLEARASASGLA